MPIIQIRITNIHIIFNTVSNYDLKQITKKLFSMLTSFEYIKKLKPNKIQKKQKDGVYFFS